jgi:hypothetical protein
MHACMHTTNTDTRTHTYIHAFCAEQKCVRKGLEKFNEVSSWPRCAGIIPCMCACMFVCFVAWIYMFMYICMCGAYTWLMPDKETSSPWADWSAQHEDTDICMHLNGLSGKMVGAFIKAPFFDLKKKIYIHTYMHACLPDCLKIVLQLSRKIVWVGKIGNWWQVGIYIHVGIHT